MLKKHSGWKNWFKDCWKAVKQQCQIKVESVSEAIKSCVLLNKKCSPG